MDRQYSIDVALKEFDDQIEKVHEECVELSELIDNPNIPLEQKKNKLYIELAQKETLLKELIDRREKLEDISKTTSYNGKNTVEGKTNYSDKQINRINQKIANYKKILASTKETSKSQYIMLSRKRAQKAIESLKKKKGIKENW